MGSRSDPPISQWILGARRGEPRAVEGLWQCYFERLVRLARQKLAGTPRRVADEEDVALSAFASFCRAAEAGRFPDLANRQGLWRLLIRLTAEKVVDQARRQGRLKRGGGRVTRSVIGAGDDALAEIVGDTPTPEFAAMVAEECARLLAALNDDLRPIALAKMEDYTNEEIAARLDCSLSTVERGLRLIRKIWRSG